tara:strand:- start:1496 stop:2119 length:624 start_codon:yes stop_codon:yes gene_type:complete
MEMNSVQTQEVSDSTEINKTEINEVADKAADTMPEDFKKDFFKQKQLMRDAQAEKQALADEVAAFREKENERLGNHQKIIDTLKEENKSLKESHAKSEKKKQYEKFNSTLEAKARDMGFTKPERIINFLSDDDKALLNIDADYNVDEYGLEKAFDNVKKEWAELFRPKNVKIADGAVMTNLNKAPEKSASQMTTAERMMKVKELMKK